jgi:hypothetical protein
MIWPLNPPEYDEPEDEPEPEPFWSQMGEWWLEREYEADEDEESLDRAAQLADEISIAKGIERALWWPKYGWVLADRFESCDCDHGMSEDGDVCPDCGNTGWVEI